MTRAEADVSGHDLPTAPVEGDWLRVADIDWAEPLDGRYAGMRGQRWNPPGSFDTVYLCGDLRTARANVRRLFLGQPYGPEDLDPDLGPVLVSTRIPAGVALDAFTDQGLRRIGLPDTYPLDASGEIVSHAVCQPLGEKALAAGLDGVLCRSAAPGGIRELAYFTRGRGLAVVGRTPFSEWYWPN